MVCGTGIHKIYVLTFIKNVLLTDCFPFVNVEIKAILSTEFLQFDFQPITFEALRHNFNDKLQICFVPINNHPEILDQKVSYLGDFPFASLLS